MTLSKRLNQLEQAIKPHGTWSDRAPWAQKMARVMAAFGAGLELDFTTGDLVTLPELRRIDPAWAALIDRNAAQFAEVWNELDETD
jgi:hypothetical protein